MTQKPSSAPQASPGQMPARVIAMDGTWACLWIPQTGQTTWVDLAELDYESP